MCFLKRTLGTNGGYIRRLTHRLVNVLSTFRYFHIMFFEVFLDEELVVIRCPRFHKVQSTNNVFLKVKLCLNRILQQREGLCCYYMLRYCGYSHQSTVYWLPPRQRVTICIKGDLVGNLWAKIHFVGPWARGFCYCYRLYHKKFPDINTIIVYLIET